MSIFTLAISCLTTSKLSWFMDQYSSFLGNIVLYSIGLYFHHQTYPQLGIVFILARTLHSFWSSFSSLLKQHIRHLPIWEFIFQCHMFLPCHTVHGILKAIIWKWFAIHLSSGPHFVRPLQHDLSALDGPTLYGSSFH